MIASSSSSPPMRTDCATTMPASEMTATSLVPPPMSTIMLPGRLGHGQTRSDGGRHRLLDKVGGPGAGADGGLLDRPPLHPGDPRGHAHHHARMSPAVLVDPLDEVAQHLLGDVEVGDDAVFERPDGGDGARGAAQHALGVGADRQHLSRPGVDGHHRRLGEDDAPSAHVHQRGGGAQIDCHISSGKTGDELSKGYSASSKRALTSPRPPGPRRPGIIPIHCARGERPPTTAFAAE